jgi:hypothetical protein
MGSSGCIRRKKAGTTDEVVILLMNKLIALTD